MSLEGWVVEQGVYYYFLVKFACLLDCLYFCLFFLFAFFPYPHSGMVWKISSPAHNVSKLSISITSDDVTSKKEEEMHELYQQFNCEYVNAILEVCLTRHDCTVPFHSYVLYVLWAQIHTRVSTVNILSVVKKFPSWNIANILSEWLGNPGMRTLGS